MPSAFSLMVTKSCAWLHKQHRLKPVPSTFHAMQNGSMNSERRYFHFPRAGTTIKSMLYLKVYSVLMRRGRQFRYLADMGPLIISCLNKLLRRFHSGV